MLVKMDRDDLLRLAGTAAGVLAFAPSAPPKARSTLLGYGAFWRRWQAGERWDGAQPAVRRYAEAAVRWCARERLKAEAADLETALAEEDARGAERAASGVEECLAVLRAMPAVSSGRRVRQGRAEGGAAA